MGISVQWGTILYTLVVFALLLFILHRLAYKPLLGMMQRRQDRIENQLATAEKNRDEAAKYLAEQKEELTQARNDAKKILDQARAISQKEADDILARAKTEAQSLKEDAVKEIQQEKVEAMAALRDQVGTLSVLLASKIIEQQLDEKAQAKLIDQYLKEVGEER
ncbi:F0F1 ATP synthase subunit B [Rubeoparvulum massiliense]|uniref:F0F1 ATP synthase subunit B n=1 Tax=Rubeoparvulum massiliense TaxID=1631346 RepID=UPI0009755870|nr:F0F1 ATP synthase subunit B [Rubeoparvulum massiliense]